MKAPLETSCLSLKRRAGEYLIISVAETDQPITEDAPGNIRIIVKEFGSNFVKLVLIGPKKYAILRGELFEENTHILRKPS